MYIYILHVKLSDSYIHTSSGVYGFGNLGWRYDIGIGVIYIYVYGVHIS